MYRFAVLSWLVFVFSVGFIFCDENEMMKKEWINHQHRVSHVAFPCEKPQKRTVDFKELVDNDTWAEVDVEDVNVIPRRTVLQRCFSAGSCRGKLSCLPSKTENRHLIFAIETNGKPIKFKNVTATDHISCMCQADTNIPK
ncbi:uncharacterized protein LOC108914425 [Anoplophora glabripennis]|uniref:uncharacterized protein LOC108914425 n=1 Tax=Anoplophora glabripennis TaxID=217634 RepID=UPI000875764B|nr:uncharacterized protein LOC108914425 [Anoplophora glabripennis]